MKIAFICTGNTCRSSMAEALARKWLENHAPDRRDVLMVSAGLAAEPGSPASENAVRVMNMSGIDLSAHQATQFSARLAEQCDIILAMTESHKKSVLRALPHTRDKVFTLTEYCGDSSVGDIADPYGKPVETYRKCAAVLQELIDKALHKMLK